MEIPYIELVHNKWFVITNIATFLSGAIFVSVMPFIKWDLYKAEIYCELLNTIHPGGRFFGANYMANSTLAQLATSKINNPRYIIRWNLEANQFTVTKRPTL